MIRVGSLTIEWADGTRDTFGRGAPHARIVLHDRAVGRTIAARPHLSFGETYMDGRWSVEDGDLADLLELLMRNDHAATAGRRRRGLMRRLGGGNTARAARRNARHHYDVGNDIYRHFLDADWQYSCAYFSEPHMTLEAAQLAKKRHIAAKLLLEPGQRVLDIGCGWGGMALYLNKAAGVSVHGITLAHEQIVRARERARAHPDVTFSLADYRSLDERFDRIVSVGMFEHVGREHYETYFRTIANTLVDDGVALVHSIGRTGPGGETNPFIAKYIFPGGYIPSLSEVLPAVEASGLIVTDLEIWRLHYARTLNAWAERFAAARRHVVRERGERFARMWEFYLAGSEAAFRTGDMMVFQMQLARDLSAVPLTRDYMMRAERTLAAREGASAPSLVARTG